MIENSAREETQQGEQQQGEKSQSVMNPNQTMTNIVHRSFVQLSDQLKQNIGNGNKGDGTVKKLRLSLG